MRNYNDNDLKISQVTDGRVRRFDTLSARELGHYARQVEMIRFIRSAVQGLIKSIADWNRRNTLHRELNALPDHLLKDIGFSRGQIPAVINNELRRETYALSPTAGETMFGQGEIKAKAPAEAGPETEKSLAA
ncbi:MAG: DUF1127 domain-containing protein [Proteobacteria bacterium]|nr:DUF1127 domain-containing protein [Pseudomonadota bacterium]